MVALVVLYLWFVFVYLGSLNSLKNLQDCHLNSTNPLKIQKFDTKFEFNGQFSIVLFFTIH